MQRTTILRATEEEIKGKRPVGQQKFQEGTRGNHKQKHRQEKKQCGKK
jgi:hypothetical protein